jgi:hypothetical protein
MRRLKSPVLTQLADFAHDRRSVIRLDPRIGVWHGPAALAVLRPRKWTRRDRKGNRHAGRVSYFRWLEAVGDCRDPGFSSDLRVGSRLRLGRADQNNCGDSAADPDPATAAGAAGGRTTGFKSDASERGARAGDAEPSARGSSRPTGAAKKVLIEPLCW